jgi:hypothetical protein
MEILVLNPRIVLVFLAAIRPLHLVKHSGYTGTPGSLRSNGESGIRGAFSSFKALVTTDYGVQTSFMYLSIPALIHLRLQLVQSVMVYLLV